MDRRTFGKLAGLTTIGTWIKGRTADAIQPNPGNSSGYVSRCLTLSKDTESQVLHNGQYVERMPPARHPQLVYWFWHPDTLANSQYLKDVENMATKSAFTMAIVTSRENLDQPRPGVDFYDFAKMHEPLSQTVRAAHSRNLKIGLQVWEFWALTRINDPVTKERPRLPVEQSLALVTEGEVVLDAHGHAEYSVTSTEGRDREAFHSELLKVWAFQKTGEGYYAEDSLTDITASVTTVKTDAGSITMSINAPADMAGRTAYVLVAHYHDYPDLFNGVMIDTFHHALEHYADIPFDGTALDEFGYMMLKPKREKPFRDRFYGHAFAAEYKQRTGMELERCLFDMRFAP